MGDHVVMHRPRRSVDRSEPRVTNEDIIVAVATLNESVKSLVRGKMDSDAVAEKMANDIKSVRDMVNDMRMDIAIIQTQHASFWKASTIFGTVVLAFATGVGWIVGEIATWFRG